MALTTVPVELANLDGAVTINESSADVDVRIETNGDSHRVFIDGGNDRVLIGTTASRAMSGVTPDFFIEGTSYADSGLGAVINANGAIDCPVMLFGKSRGTSLGSNTIVQNGDRLFTMRFDGSDGTNLEQAALIEAYVDAAPGANEIPGRLSFWTTTDGSQYSTEKMRIDNAGDVSLAANATGAARIKGVSGDQDDRNAGGYPQYTFVGNEGTGMRRVSANTLAFDSGGDERVRIDSAGNLGIGHVPESYGSGYKALDIGSHAGIMAGASGSAFYLNENSYWDGSNFKAKNTAAGSQYQQADGTHRWKTMASVSADANQTVEERMRIRLDGNVGIGSVGMACFSSYTQLSIGTMAHVMAENTSGTGRSLHISQNAHLDTDGSWETMETDEASNYYQTNGGHYFRVAGSTSAGTDITWKTAAYLNSSGHLIVGSSSHADDTLYLIRSGNGKLLRFYSGSTEVGYISTNTYSLPSDRNSKKDIEDLTLGLDFVKDLKPKQYRQKIEDSDVPLQTGLIAQDVEESLTAAGVSKNKYMMLQHTPNDEEGASQYGMDYGKLIPVLINAIQEQQELIETLQTKVKALEEA